MSSWAPQIFQERGYHQLAQTEKLLKDHYFKRKKSIRVGEFMGVLLLAQIPNSGASYSAPPNLWVSCFTIFRLQALPNLRPVFGLHPEGRISQISSVFFIGLWSSRWLWQGRKQAATPVRRGKGIFPFMRQQPFSSCPQISSLPVYNRCSRKLKLLTKFSCTCG